MTGLPVASYAGGQAGLTSPVTSRERFLVLLNTQPSLPADVVAVCCGEDGKVRAEVAAAVVRGGFAPLVYLTGGLESEAKIGAAAAWKVLVGAGISPDRILSDTTASNTREQALCIAAEAEARQWNRVILVASAYHLPRAFLTVLKALLEHGIADKVRVIPVAPRSDWHETIPGTDAVRLDRLAPDLAKIETYAEHVASFQEGIDYLLSWESK